MATDPRNNLGSRTPTFSIAPCEKGQKIQQAADAQKKDFFGALGKVGDLEILNKVGLSKVGEGLRTLAHTSNSIRTGQASPDVMGDDANGTNKVLDTVGINPHAAQQVATFSPGVANKAYGQAQSIFDKVKRGNFQVSDIPNAITDLQNLSTLIDGIYTNPNNDKREFELCGASPYAVDLISYAPKYKFMFVIDLAFTKPYQEITSDLNAAFVVKSSTRPNISFEYEEINMYNYWTKIPKRTIYEPMTMKFYDDNKNQAMELYNLYLRSRSPIALLKGNGIEGVRGILESDSMNFAKGQTGYAASFGPTPDDDTMNILSHISLFHVYDSGRLMNVYKFINPKILSMELDDLDMADNGNGNEISFQFVYDAVQITPNVPTTSTEYSLQSLSTGRKGATYALHNVDPTPMTVPEAPSPEKSSAWSSFTGAIDSGKKAISNAFTGANQYLGSKFL